ncbi:Retrovirus-related Pol polyprotein from transposon TNT 1-94, partial [Araneus ventricosus]
MDAEMHNMKTRKVWSLVPAPPKEVKVVGCRWVYNLKKNNEDDIVILGKTNEEIQMTVKLLANNFDLKIIGKTRTLLGIQFIEKNNKVYLSREHYITEVYNRYKKFLPPISSLPISKGSVYSKLQCPTTDEETKEIERYPYRSVIGCLAFIASRTRPDINYAVNLFSQFQSNPGVVHWSGLMKLLGYLQATKNYKLDIGNIAEISLTAYSDADFASCTDDRISVGGHIVFCGIPVSWRTAKQKSVTLSSMEAEFLSICETAKELMWLKNVLEECQSTNVLLGDISCKLLSDNMAAIQFSKSSIENNRTKHIDVKFHFVR